jgi:hypothetical protein
MVAGRPTFTGSRSQKGNEISTKTGLRVGRQGFDSREGQGIFFGTASRPSLGPIKPPIPWVPGALSPRVKRQGREAYHSPPSSGEVRNAWSYTSIVHINWGMVLR